MLKKIRERFSFSRNRWSWLAMIGILVFSFLLILPQLLSKGVIAGSDFLFHYNRFYETAMQIKSGNYNYFISLYGFSSSGRIVNALYGPYFAYFQGLLVLISRNWFTYQLVSRFLLSSIAGFSIYGLIRRVSVKPKIALALALFYMMTFSVQYWTFRQGFSSWGAVIMPWCLISGIDFVRTKRIGILRLAVSVALMVQVHMLSAFLLILAYLPFYAYGFVISKEKKKVIFSVLAAAVLALLLTTNVWAALIEVGSKNNLVEPFINSDLYNMTVNQQSTYWLTTPLPLLFMIGYQLYFSFKHWHCFDQLLRVIIGTFFFFLVLSSSIFPWYSVNKMNLSIVNLIQFPFRFFVPATVLLLVAFSLIIERYFDFKWGKIVTVVLISVNCYGLWQLISLQNQDIFQYYFSKQPVESVTHQYIEGNANQVRTSFYSSNLSDLLDLVSKSTPDYLPSDKANTSNKYTLYEDYILKHTDNFKKHQEAGNLALTWTADTDRLINIPIVKYADTQLTLNGKVLTNNDYRLSGIGTPQLRQAVGQNTLKLTYTIGSWFSYLLIFNCLSWLVTIIYAIFRKKESD